MHNLESFSDMRFPYTMFTLQTGGGIISLVQVTLNSKEENSEDMCPNYANEFGLRTALTTSRVLGHLLYIQQTSNTAPITPSQPTWTEITTCYPSQTSLPLLIIAGRLICENKSVGAVQCTVYSVQCTVDTICRMALGHDAE